jgi:hypothetical protein
MNKKIIFIIIFLTSIVSGCAEKKSICGDPEVVSALPAMLKDKLKYEKFVSIKILSTQKDESAAKDQRKCKGIAEAMLRDDVIEKFENYNKIIMKELGVGWQDINLKPHQFEFNFEIKKNEMTGGDATTATWKTFEQNINYIPVELFEKIDENLKKIPFAKINKELEKWMRSSERTVQETYNYIDSMDKLPLKQCTKIMDMQSNPPTLDIFCTFENSGGIFKTVSSIPKPEVALFKALMDEPLFAMFGGKSTNNLPMKSEKLNEDELKNYLASKIRIEFSEANSELY